MEQCIRCKISESEVRLYNAIYEGRNALICERCSIIENIPIIEMSQNYEIEKTPTVLERMKKLAGIQEIKKQETFVLKDRLNQVQEISHAEKKLEMEDYFHWNLMRARRRKGLTQEQLANYLGESAIDIDKLERAIMPTNAGQIIKKIEQFLKIKLRKIDELQEIAVRKSRPPVLLDENGNVLDHIPEPEPAPLPEPEIKQEPEKKIRKIIVMPKSEEDFIARTEKHSLNIEGPKPFELPYAKGRSSFKDMQESTGTIQPITNQTIQATQKIIEKSPIEIIDIESGDIDIQKAKMSNAKISDLREMHKQKINLTKQEKIDESKKIEERQKLIEARKEEIISIKQKQSQDLHQKLGGLELLKKNQNPDYIDDKTLEEYEEEIERDFYKFEKDNDK